jgi:hypothetical protein
MERSIVTTQMKGNTARDSYRWIAEQAIEEHVSLYKKMLVMK